jgi:hypothetical protein
MVYAPNSWYILKNERGGLYGQTQFPEDAKYIGS